MKIGTDAVLLGAWVNLENNPFSVLDIGAGTGILSLMLAQRSYAELIDALEIDDNAYEQCVGNFEQSPWGDRLFCYHASLQQFTEEIEDKYDLIISNPPFYSENYKTDNTQRDLARFTDALPFEHLLYGTAKLLAVNISQEFLDGHQYDFEEWLCDKAKSDVDKTIKKYGETIRSNRERKPRKRL